MTTQWMGKVCNTMLFRGTSKTTSLLKLDAIVSKWSFHKSSNKMMEKEMKQNTNMAYNHGAYVH